MNQKSIRRVLAVLLAVSGLVGAVTAQGADSAASPFELTLESQAPWDESSSKGTFAAGAPFCGSGTFVELARRVGVRESKYRLTCDDGSGSLVVSASVGLDDHIVIQPSVIEGSWRILEGVGSYVGLRGKGSQRSEIVSELDPECVPESGFDCPWWIPTWRSTLEGVAAEDAIAPAIRISSVEVRKLSRPAGAYSLELAIALRDDVEGNPVSYTLRVTPTTSARELASNVGTTQAGTVSTTMRIRYYKSRVQAVVLRFSASDEVGNESSISQVVQLPR